MNTWVKIRCDLASDPKVHAIATILQQKRDALRNESVTRCATVTQQCHIAVAPRTLMRHAVVGALSAIWNVVRAKSANDEGDAVMLQCDLTYIDDVTQLDGFGIAMESAGWVRIRENSLVFPEFFTELNSDECKRTKRSKAAERQQRCRDKKKKLAAETQLERNGCATVAQRERDSLRNESVTNVAFDTGRVREREREYKETGKPTLHPSSTTHGHAPHTPQPPDFRDLNQPMTDRELAETACLRQIDQDASGIASRVKDEEEFIRRWNELPEGIRGVCRVSGLPPMLSPKDRESLCGFWANKRDAAIQAMAIIKAGGIRWNRPPMTITAFANEIDKLLAGGHGIRHDGSVSPPMPAVLSERSRYLLSRVDTSVLTIPAKLLAWYNAAAEAGLLLKTDNERMNTFGLAEHAIESGENPAALFVNAIQNHDFGKTTDAQEDRGYKKLKALLYPKREAPRPRQIDQGLDEDDPRRRGDPPKHVSEALAEMGFPVEKAGVK